MQIFRLADLRRLKTHKLAVPEVTVCVVMKRYKWEKSTNIYIIYIKYILNKLHLKYIPSSSPLSPALILSLFTTIITYLLHPPNKDILIIVGISKVK